MKKSTIILATALLLSAFSFAGYVFTKAENPTQSKFSKLTDQDKAELIASINSDCTWNGISLKGKVQFVTSYPDIKIQYVTSYPDIKVQWVTSYPDDCGEWQEVTSYPDFKVQVVTSYPDVKVQEVTSYPGL